MLFLGSGAAHLDMNHFTMKRLVTEGMDAYFDCLFEDSLLTEWYYKDKRLSNTKGKR